MKNPVETLQRIEELRAMFKQNTATKKNLYEAVAIYFNMPSGMAKMYIWCKLTVDAGRKWPGMFAQAIAFDLVDVVDNKHSGHSIPDYWWTEDFRQLVAPTEKNEAMHNDGLMAFSARDMFA